MYLEPGSGDVGELDVIREGLAVVQDEGSQLVALAAVRAPLPDGDGGRWLDLCAGPGGKAVLLGALAALDGASVDAVEINEHRADLVRRAVHGLPVTVHVGDGRDTPLPGRRLRPRSGGRPVLGPRCVAAATGGALAAQPR